MWMGLVGILAIMAVAGYLYHKGGSDERAHQAVEQLKQNAKVRKSYDKIDKQTPFDGDKQHALEWLRQYGRQ